MNKSSYIESLASAAEIVAKIRTIDAPSLSYISNYCCLSDIEATQLLESWLAAKMAGLLIIIGTHIGINEEDCTLEAIKSEINNCRALRTICARQKEVLEMFRDSKAGDDPEPIIKLCEEALTLTPAIVADAIEFHSREAEKYKKIADENVKINATFADELAAQQSEIACLETQIKNLSMGTAAYQAELAAKDKRIAVVEKQACDALDRAKAAEAKGADLEECHEVELTNTSAKTESKQPLQCQNGGYVKPLTRDEYFKLYVKALKRAETAEDNYKVAVERVAAVEGLVAAKENSLMLLRQKIADCVSALNKTESKIAEQSEELAKLHGAIEEIKISADSHWEYNPIDKKSRQPKGYTCIIGLCQQALAQPTAQKGPQV